jgi:tRNA1(Val) A37 N6-methylase TrmN6
MTASSPAPVLPAHTLDAFHRGRFHLLQPAERGHRAGMDAMMLAAAVPSAFAGRLADFGAGAGAAGLAVLSRCAGARALLVERSRWPLSPRRRWRMRQTRIWPAAPPFCAPT